MKRFAPPLAAMALVGCKDVARFSNGGDHYEGTIVQASFVRAGFDASMSLCLVLDANQLQVVPGTISSSDGRFQATPLRPIPQVWHDPLSTFDFGEGRVENLLYIATPTLPDGGADADVTVVLSLMQAGNVEMRLLRGAPSATGVEGSSLFGVFSMNRAGGPCPF